MSASPLLPIPEDWQRALAIVAHPDDLEYGASSPVARWTDAGRSIAYLLVTRGEAGIEAWPPARSGPAREQEERESARLVGVDQVEFLDYQDGVVEYGLPLRRDLARAIRRQRPEVLITISFELAWPSGNLNQSDHRAVGLAVLDAARDAGNRWIFPELLAEGLEPWGGVRYVFVSGVAAPTHICGLDENDLARGIASLQAHRAYFENLKGTFDPASFLRQQAEQAGERSARRYAAEFALYSV